MIDMDGREATNAHHGGPSPGIPQAWEDTWKSERQNEHWAMEVGKHLVGKCADKTLTNIYIHAKFLRILTERYGPLVAWVFGTAKEIEDRAQGQSPAET